MTNIFNYLSLGLAATPMLGDMAALSAAFATMPCNAPQAAAAGIMWAASTALAHNQGRLIWDAQFA